MFNITKYFWSRCQNLFAISAFVLLALPTWVGAQVNPFANGWTLQADASKLNFQSTKNETKTETSSFATFAGSIDESGVARVTVKLESVDTKIDLRNVRMRFLFFESFQYPEAVITTQITPSLIADLQQVRRKTIPLTYTLDLHGVTKGFEAQTVVTLLSDDMVAVSSTTPVSVAAADFNLMGGIQKLQEAAGVRIIPTATVTFDFLFKRNGSGDSTMAAATPPEQPASAALEPTGQLDAAACRGRFEILSRTDNIYFNSGSARLDPASTPLLNSLVDIIKRCPDMVIEVGGHTDSDGSSAANKRLSKARAKAVVNFLHAKGVDRKSLVSVGYGEDKPAFANDTRENKRRNRRIEFAVIKG